MKPSLRQMEYFVAIAETGSFIEAARRCYVSQPSLSQQLQDMEAILGQVLFERSRKGIKLTPFGENALPLVREILTKAKFLREMGRISADGLSGQIALGVLTSIGPYLLPYAAKSLHESYPDLRLQVIEGTMGELSSQLRDGRIEAFIGVDVPAYDFPRSALFSEQLYICSALDDPLGDNDSPIAPEKLAGRELLSLGPDHHISTLVAQIAHLGGASVNAEYAGTSLDAVRQMSLMGFTISILPSLYCVSEARRDPDIFIRRIDHEQAQRQICLYWRASSPLAKRYERLAQILSETGQGLLKELGS